MKAFGIALAFFCCVSVFLPHKEIAGSWVDPGVCQEGAVAQEVEPNNRIAYAQAIPIPVTIHGTVNDLDMGEILVTPPAMSVEDDIDDLFSFQASRDGFLRLKLVEACPLFCSFMVLSIDRSGGTKVLGGISPIFGDEELQLALPVGAYIVGAGVFSFAYDVPYTFQLSSLDIRGDMIQLIDTAPPTVTVNYPDGGENLRSGSSVTVRWNSSDILGTNEIEPNDNVEEATRVVFPVRVTGRASDADGGSIVIPLGTANDAVEDLYKLSPPYDSETRVRLSFTDQEADLDLYMFEVRDGALRLVAFSTNSGAHDESITYSLPEGAPEEIVIGVSAFDGASDYTMDITSDRAAIDSVGVTLSHDVLVSSDGGMTYVQLTERLPGSVRSFDWAIPPRFSTAQARIRVIARDAAGNVGFDDSDGNFAVAH